MNKIEIPLRKSKLVLGIGGSCLFIVLSLYLFMTIADRQTKFEPLIVKGVGIAGIVCFGATGIYGIMKLFDNTAGLTIDDKGIIDNTNASSVGLIKWDDITSIKTKQVMSTKFLLIYTRDPNVILEKVRGLKRKLMAGNMKMYGTPLTITSNTLNYNFNDLEKLLQTKLKESRELMANS